MYSSLMPILSRHSIFLLILLSLSLHVCRVDAYNCLVARQRSITDTAQLKGWHRCLDRWQSVDNTDNGVSIAAGQLKTCGGRTWWSNLHEWHSIAGCLKACSSCLGMAIDLGADAATCYERVAIAPYTARCMLGYNPKPRTEMRLLVCNEPDSTHDACHVNPFIDGGHLHDLAAAGKKEPELGEVIDVGCSIQNGLCMNWPLNGMIPQFIPWGQTETPGDKKRDTKPTPTVNVDGSQGEGHSHTHVPDAYPAEYTGEWMS